MTDTKKPEKRFGDKLVLKEFTEEGHRLLSLDAFKGWAIFLMIFINTTSHFDNIPWWLTHSAYNSGVTLTLADLVSPMFISAIALTLQPQLFRAIKTNGFFEGVMKYISRFFFYVGLGMIYSFSIEDGTFVFTWGVLQSIGMAGLICLVFVGFNWKKRLVAGIILLILYQLLMGVEISGSYTMSQLIYNSEHCGFFGGFGWGILMLFATVISEFIYEKKIIYLLPTGTALIVLGYILDYAGYQISMKGLTVPYIITSIGYISLFLLAFIWLYDVKMVTKSKSPILQKLGKNAIALYLFHGIIAGIAYGVLELDAPMIYPILFGILNIIVTCILAIAMDKYHVHIKF